MEEKRKKRSIVVPKGFIVLIIIFLGLVSLYIYDKNLFPVFHVKLEPGVYELVGKDEGSMIVSEGNKIMFKDFDLNKHLKGTYYKQGTDLNSMFLNNNRTSRILNSWNGIYSVLYDVDEYHWLEIDYYPREDKLVLLKPGSTTEFSFVYKET